MNYRHAMLIVFGVSLLLIGVPQLLISQVIVAKDLTVHSARQIELVAEESALTPVEREAIAAHLERILLCNRHYRQLASRRFPRVALMLSFTGGCLAVSGVYSLLKAKKRKGKSNIRMEPISGS